MTSGSNGISLRRVLLLLFVFLVFGMTQPIAPVLNGMDSCSHATTTSSPAARCFLNRRIVLSSGFNLYSDDGWSLLGREGSLRAKWKGAGADPASRGCGQAWRTASAARSRL